MCPKNDRLWECKERKNPNDPARFIAKVATTEDGELAKISRYLDEDKIKNESQFDGLYAVCTNLLADEVSGILRVSEGQWQIEEFFRIMKTDFDARPVYLWNHYLFSEKNRTISTHVKLF